jgi:two-component system, NarL family, response regulator NreC
MGLTIALADDHPLVRRGLRAVLEGEPDFRLLGEATDGLEAAALVERVKPDVLVLDLMMPGLNGLEVLRQTSQRAPATRVVVLSMHANEAYVLEALRNGAAAYVLKDSSVDDLVRAVREVGAGRRYLSSDLSARAIDAYVEKAQDHPADPYDTLTTREREVLQLAAEGHSSNEIAARLSISPRTAETHRTHLMRKIGTRTQTDLVRYAIRRGIITVEG